LRWTAAIAAKAEKLIGNPQKNLLGYLQKGIVGPGDAYVIAVNGRRLRDVFPQLNGINGYPFAVEATLGIGYQRLHIDKQTRAVVGADHEQRAFVTRQVVREGETHAVAIPTRVFLDPAWAGISAIWAGDIDDSHVLGNSRQLAVIHNPLASTPLPTRLLPAFKEYVAVPQDEGFVLTEIDGRLASDREPTENMASQRFS
jgi:type I restriction enzyme S subunit